MPRFEPFAALRYSPDEPLDDVTAPPYDVLSTADVDNLLTRHDHNIVAIDVPLIATVRIATSWPRRRLSTNGSKTGVLVTRSAPSLTLYRMEFIDEAGRGRETVGVHRRAGGGRRGRRRCAASRTHDPKAKTDRLDLTRATRTQPLAHLGAVVDRRPDRPAA